MKKLYNILLITVALLISFSCNEEEWLKEEPLDFYAPENSFSTPENFNSAIARLYENVYYALYDINNGASRSLFYPTDIAWDAIAETHDLNLYNDKLFSNTGQVQSIWSYMYEIIFNANVILGRIENPEIIFDTESQKSEFMAEARFFRGFAYRTLAILFGGVPIVLEEITTPVRNFTRASKEEVLNQVVADLQFAGENLPDINSVPQEGRLPQAAAYHLLAEVYIIMEQWDNAINAAIAVIDNPDFSLMTERFGTRMDEPGDVYWDLFRRDNQNRSSGNTEGIWVSQYEYLVEGGGRSQVWPRFLGPFYWQLKDPNGVNLFIGPSNHYGGRGIGWFASTDYMRNLVWESDFDNDIRNSSYNIIRDIKADNPDSEYYDQYIVESGAIDDFPNALDRWWSLIYAKVTPINNFPDEFILNPATGLTNNSANETYTDNYIFRLAETYLLRAEAYLGKGQLSQAADDINMVRQRANATPVAAADVTIDYILDERARELAWEELRLLTLMRLNKLVERVKLYNPVTGNNIDDHQNLWPIPQREIETNTESQLQQNPGYDVN